MNYDYNLEPVEFTESDVEEIVQEATEGFTVSYETFGELYEEEALERIEDAVIDYEATLMDDDDRIALIREEDIKNRIDDMIKEAVEDDLEEVKEVITRDLVDAVIILSESIVDNLNDTLSNFK